MQLAVFITRDFYLAISSFLPKLYSFNFRFKTMHTMCTFNEYSVVKEKLENNISKNKSQISKPFPHKI